MTHYQSTTRCQQELPTNIMSPTASTLSVDTPPLKKIKLNKEWNGRLPASCALRIVKMLSSSFVIKSQITCKYHYLLPLILMRRLACEAKKIGNIQSKKQTGACALSNLAIYFIRVLVGPFWSCVRLHSRCWPKDNQVLKTRLTTHSKLHVNWIFCCDVLDITWFCLLVHRFRVI